MGKRITAMGRELPSFDLVRSPIHQTAKFLALLSLIEGLQVLNLRHVLADEHGQGHIRNPAHPGVADQVPDRGHQPFRLSG